MTQTIVIFAAGLGTRMGELTQEKPKSLVTIDGKTLLQRALEFTKWHKFDRIIINTHYFSQKIEEFIEQFQKNNPEFPKIFTEYEPELLETGGTIKKLYNLYDLEEKIFTLNSDVIIDAKENPFDLMLKEWEKLKPDLLLLMQPTKNAYGYVGSGDFYMDKDSMLNRNGPTPYPYMFTGMHLVNPAKIDSIKDKIFSFKECYPPSGKFSDQFKIRGTLMKGNWYHATSPEDVDKIEHLLNPHSQNLQIKAP